MTKLTAVDWGRGIEENQVPAHILIPALPYHRSDRTREPRTDTEVGGSWGNLMSHSAELSTPPPLQYENITVMKILLIAVAFPLDKLQRFFSAIQLFGEPRWNPRRHHRQCPITVGRPCVNFCCAQSKKGLEKKRLNWQLRFHNNGTCDYFAFQSGYFLYSSVSLCPKSICLRCRQNNTLLDRSCWQPEIFFQPKNYKKNPKKQKTPLVTKAAKTQTAWHPHLCGTDCSWSDMNRKKIIMLKG